MWTSTDSSNFAVVDPLTSEIASAGAYSCSRSILARASRNFLPCLGISGFVRSSGVGPDAAIAVPAKDAGRAQWRSHGPDRGRTQGRRASVGSAADERTGPLGHVHAHRAGGARDDLGRRVDVVGVEVGQLLLGDRAQLGLGDLPDLLAV